MALQYRGHGAGHGPVGHTRCIDPAVETIPQISIGTVTVMITVTDVNEAPVVSGDDPVDFDEGAEGDIATMRWPPTQRPTRTMATILTWSVGGADGSKFNIGNETNGQPPVSQVQEEARLREAHRRQRGQRVRGDGAGVRRQEDRHEEGDGTPST